jgi:hypothetical protein
MKVKVLKSTHNYWYSVLIGHEVEVRECNDTWWFSIQHKNLILKSDSQLVEEITSEEYVYNKLMELENLNPTDEIRCFFKDTFINFPKNEK